MSDSKRDGPPQSGPDDLPPPGARMKRLKLLSAVADSRAAAGAVGVLDVVPAAALRGVLVDLLGTPRLSTALHAHVCVLADFYTAHSPVVAGGAVSGGAGGRAALERLPDAVFGQVAAYVDGADLLGAVLWASRRMRAKVGRPGCLRSLAVGDVRTAERASELLPAGTWAGLERLRLELARPPPECAVRGLRFLGPRLRHLELCGSAVDVRLVPLAAWAAVHACRVDEYMNDKTPSILSLLPTPPYLERGSLRALHSLSLRFARVRLYAPTTVPTATFEVLSACVGRTLRVLSLQCAALTPEMRAAVEQVAPWLEEFGLEVLPQYELALWEVPPLPRAHTIVLQAHAAQHCFRMADAPYLALRHLRTTAGGSRRLEVPASPVRWAVGELREVLFPAHAPLETLRAFLPGFGPQLRRVRLDVRAPAVFEWALRHVFPYVEDLSFLSPYVTAEVRRGYVAALLALPRLRRLGLDDCLHLTPSWWAAQQCGPALREVSYPEETDHLPYQLTHRPRHWPAHVKWGPHVDVRTAQATVGQ